MVIRFFIFAVIFLGVSFYISSSLNEHKQIGSAPDAILLKDSTPVAEFTGFDFNDYAVCVKVAKYLNRVNRERPFACMYR